MTQATFTEFDLEQFLPYRLSVLTNTVSQGIARSYRGRFDLSVTEWRILAVLGRFPGLTAREVTERTAMDKVSISRAVSSLEQKELLQRKTDAGDRRRQQLFVTPGRGREVIGQVIPEARRYEEALASTLSAEEISTLSNLIEKLQHRARELNIAPPRRMPVVGPELVRE